MLPATREKSGYSILLTRLKHIGDYSDTVTQCVLLYMAGVCCSIARFISISYIHESLHVHVMLMLYGDAAAKYYHVHVYWKRLRSSKVR